MHASWRERAVADRADLVIVWGGDGTLNEVGAALLGTDTAIGLVPAGSGNGLAGGAGHASRSRRRHCTRARRSATRASTPARSPAGRSSTLRASASTRASPAGSTSARWAPAARWPYIVIGVTEGCRYASQEYEVELDGDRRRLRALLIAFANGSEYGIGARISARREPGRRFAGCGGRRGSVRVRPVPARASPGVRHAGARATRDDPTGSAARSCKSDGPIEYHVDGETGVADKEVVVTILPGALLVRG